MRVFSLVFFFLFHLSPVELTWVLRDVIEGIKAAFAVCGQNIPFTATFAGGARKGDVNVVYESV